MINWKLTAATLIDSFYGFKGVCALPPQPQLTKTWRGMMSSSYSLAKAQQILKHASLLQQEETISRTQLLEIASETGISLETLQQAEDTWLVEKQAQQQQLAHQSRRQLGFKLHVIPYVAGSILMVLINLQTTPRYFWSIFPVLGWGVGVALHGVCISKK